MQHAIPDLAAPFRIGSVTIRNRVALAPMSGVSDLPFRRLAHRFGAGMVVTEMVASRELVNDREESRRRIRRDAGMVHIVQLAGREARWMGEAARIAEGEGADIVDINMGCPARKVIGGYSGSALMRDLDHALTLIEATVAAVRLPVTLKMRLGWDETSVNAPELAVRAESAGVSLVTVHGRTRCQFYEGKADWGAIRAVREAVSIPLIANGDVADAADCEGILRLSGADAVMVGRACQGRPWLAGALAGSTDAPCGPAQIAAVVAEHYEMMLEHYGREAGIRQARKHLGWYLERFAPAAPASLRKTIMTGTEPRATAAALSEAFRHFAPMEAHAASAETRKAA